MNNKSSVALLGIDGRISNLLVFFAFRLSRHSVSTELNTVSGQLGQMEILKRDGRSSFGSIVDPVSFRQTIHGEEDARVAKHSQLVAESTTDARLIVQKTSSWMNDRRGRTMTIDENLGLFGMERKR